MSLLSISNYTGVVVTDTTAIASDVLTGKKFHLADGSLATGTITSKSAQTYTPSTVNQTISAGQYLNGTQTISGDANLIALNIAKDVTIFGVTGTHEGGADVSVGYMTYSNNIATFHDLTTSNSSIINSLYITDTGKPLPLYTERGTNVSDTTAIAPDVLTGKKFHLADGSLATGTITSKSAQTYTPSTVNQTISAGQYLNGTQTISGDANLIALNIAKDVTIFGVTGTHEGGGASFYKCASVGSGTWTGYKAVWNNGGYYDYESSLTSDTLVFSLFTPTVGNSYTADGKVRGLIPINPIINSVVLTSSNHPEYEGIYCLIDTTAGGNSRIWKQQNVNHYIWSDLDDPYALAWYISDSPYLGATFFFAGSLDPISSEWMDESWESIGITTAWNT